MKKKKWYTPFYQSAQISKLLNFLQLLKRILRAFSFQGGTIRGVVGYTTLLLSPSISIYMCKTQTHYVQKHYYPSLMVSFCRYGIGIGTIWLDDVRCSGIESRLTSCLRNAYGAHNCGHSEDVAIYCRTTSGNASS